MTSGSCSAPDAVPMVFVVDDDPSVRTALEDLLASVGLRAMCFGSAQDFVDNVTPIPSAPCCVVLDIRLPGQNGLDFQRQMGSLGVHLPVIVITGHGDMPVAVRAMKQGAIDFLPKPFRDQDLISAVYQALAIDRGRRARDARLVDLRDRWLTLSQGERDVMDGVVRGLLSKQIARELDVQEITVRVRRRRIMRKMQASSVADLVRIAEALEQSTER